MSMAATLTLLVAMTGCGDDQQAAEAPPPHELTAQAVGHYCGMTLTEHAGPKGQILLRSRDEPVWFSSARDTLAFTMLPEEPKDIRAIYVSDMGHAESWDQPGARNWTDARKAVYVIGSQRRGGMGAEEAVPFAERAAAERFVAENGGRIVTFDAMPRDYVLGDRGEAAPAAEAAPEAPAAAPERRQEPAAAAPRHTH
jgi:copper chaperone NosL